MLQRCVWELSSARSAKMIRNRVISQMPFFLSSRNEFSSASNRNQTQRPAPTDKISAERPSDQGSVASKVVLGAVVIGAAAVAAYQAGYIDQFRTKDEKSRESVDAIVDSSDLKHSSGQLSFPNNGKPTTLSPTTDSDENRNEVFHVKDLDANQENMSEGKSSLEEPLPVEENDSEHIVQEALPPKDERPVVSTIVSEDSLSVNVNAENAEDSAKQNEVTQSSIELNERADDSSSASGEIHLNADAPDQDAPVETPKVIDDDAEVQKPLAYSYSLQEDATNPTIFGEDDKAGVFQKRYSANEDLLHTKEDFKDTGNTHDGRILLDLIDAIHAAERKQADTDAFIFAEEKRKLKERFEKELRDARARELMYAEEAAILDKELNKEKEKAAAKIKLLEEKAEKHLQEELQRKEEETDMQLKKVKDLAKAELTAAIANEKSSQIGRIAEANLNINALCMAFYARSEEARQSHSVHKLALGTLALEDALSKGLPIRAEIDALHKSLEGIDRDSLLSLVLSSLPVESLNSGTYTQIQLNQKFESLKGILRHYSLIPSGGGGILAHIVAHIASSIKMKEDQSGDTIESLISRVERFILEGKLAEAADALEGGVRGSEAAGVVVDWVRQARNRAIAEQALSLLQSYASSITFA